MRVFELMIEQTAFGRQGIVHSDRVISSNKKFYTAGENDTLIGLSLDAV